MLAGASAKLGAVKVERVAGANRRREAKPTRKVAKAAAVGRALDTGTVATMLATIDPYAAAAAALAIGGAIGGSIARWITAKPEAEVTAIAAVRSVLTELRGELVTKQAELTELRVRLAEAEANVTRLELGDGPSHLT